MIVLKKHLTRGQYLTGQYEKRSQFLHHTVGLTAMGAWRWWNVTPDRVGTPQMIDRDGSIWECFDPSMWAYHLGIKGDDNYHEKHSVNIEIVAAGPLHKENGKFKFYPLWPNKTRYTVIDPSEVHEFDTPWKGHKYWHKYTEAQIESLIWLIGRNLLDFPLLSIENDLGEIFDYHPEVITDHLPGLFTHNTVRKDKSDIFPYPPLIEALKGLQKEMLGMKDNVVIPAVTVVGKKSKKGKK